MSTVKSKKLQVGTDATSSNNFTIYQPASPDGTLRIGVGNADSPTEVGRFDSNGYVATNAPAFSVGLSTLQTISSSVYTKLQLNNVDFDLTSDYDTSNYRFTPTVEGYYQINTTAHWNTTGGNQQTQIAFYKNGSEIRYVDVLLNFNATNTSMGGSALVYCNGTTDYLELWAYVAGTSLDIYNNNTLTSFNGFLARAV